MEIIHGNNDNFDDLIKGEVLVDFYATWCGPCKMLGPVLEEIKDDIQIVKVDIDECEDLAKRFGVMSVPTLMHFTSPEEYESLVGYRTKDELLNWLKK